MAKFISETMIALRLIWLRVCLYALLPFLTVFGNEIKDMTGAQWDDASWFDRIKLFIPAIIAAGMAMSAFIDQSMNRAKEAIASKRAGHDKTASTGVTQFFTVEPSQPNDPNEK